MSSGMYDTNGYVLRFLSKHKFDSTQQWFALDLAQDINRENISEMAELVEEVMSARKGVPIRDHQRESSWKVLVQRRVFVWETANGEHHCFSFVCPPTVVVVGPDSSGALEDGTVDRKWFDVGTEFVAWMNARASISLYSFEADHASANGKYIAWRMLRNARDVHANFDFPNGPNGAPSCHQPTLWLHQLQDSYVSRE